MTRLQKFAAALGAFAFAAVVHICNMSAYGGELRLNGFQSGVASRGVEIVLEADNTKPLAVNINTADSEQLMRLPQIGEKRAQAIIDYRQRFGEFVSIDELSEVEGISANVFEKIKDFVVI